MRKKKDNEEQDPPEEQNDEEEPIFPMLTRARRLAAEKQAAEKQVDPPATPAEQTPDNVISIDPREESKEKIHNKRQELSAIKTASDDPGDTYETWRNEIFKPGIHKIRIWYREPNSRTFVNPPQPWIDEMIPFADLCQAHNRGAVIRIQIYKPSKEGKLAPQTPPLEIPIAPEKEYQLTGYGNPFSLSSTGQQYPATASFEKILEWSEKQAEKRDALQKESLVMQQQNSTNWLQALMAMQQNNPKQGTDQQQFLLMMQMMQQSQQSTTAMIAGMFQAMQQQSTQATQLLVAALTKDKGAESEPLMKLYEIQQNQTNMLLQNALQQHDLKGQVSLLKELQEFTEPTALGEVAKIAEAINLGDNLRNLTEAAGTRIKEGSGKKETSTPPAIPPPANKALPPAQPDHQQLAIQQAAIDQAKTAVKDPKKSGLFELLKAIKTSYLAGDKAEDLAGTIYTSQKNLAITITSFDQQAIIGKLQEYHSVFGVTELTTSAGLNFVVDFLEALSRKVKDGEQTTTENP